MICIIVLKHSSFSYLRVCVFVGEDQVCTLHKGVCTLRRGSSGGWFAGNATYAIDRVTAGRVSSDSSHVLLVRPDESVMLVLSGRSHPSGGEQMLQRL